ncbi:hypothetical protein F4604DRAFT_1939198 [Suillus subluteus]|nr:hypothetical protein F4604DRAFT_1939198 [Suillus subluteus]
MYSFHSSTDFMGRKAKYFTLVEKTAAMNKHKIRYAQSKRGKATRRLRRSQIHTKAHSCRGSSKPSIYSKLPSLPPALVQLATSPLPNSNLFHHAFQSADNIDKSELPQWDSDPPYTMPHPADTPAEARFTDNLIQVMHG